MNKKYAIVGVVLVVILVLIALQSMSKPKTQGSQDESKGQAENKQQAPVTSITPPMDKPTGIPAEAMTKDPIALSEIAKHSKAEDCWMAIEDKVYDVTAYIQKQIHPGGAAILFGCGKDSTAIFNLRPKDNKPHSQKARGYLESYYIGELAK